MNESTKACSRLDLTSLHQAFVEKNLILVGIQLIVGLFLGFFGYKICRSMTFTVVTLGVTSYFQVSTRQGIVVLMVLAIYIYI
jgi:hypothetical protein